MKKQWKAVVGVLTAAVVLAGEMNVHAATADVGQVDSFEEDYLPFDNYVTTYTGKVSKKTPTKRVVRAETYHGNMPNDRTLAGKYVYDTKGNIIKKLKGMRGLEATKGGDYYKYDKNGNLVKSISKGFEGKVNSWTVYDVDSDGEVNRETYYNQNGMYGYSDFTYKKGRIVKKNSVWYVDGGYKSTASYKYDSNGNVTTVKASARSDKSTSTYTYDKDGRLIAMHIGRAGDKPTDAQLAYDSDGYLSKITYQYGNYSPDYVEFFYETVSPTHKTKK